LKWRFALRFFEIALVLVRPIMGAHLSIRVVERNNALDAANWIENPNLT
jgi:hypothetical protein